ncbi:pancreatic triacylglycerol lipase-like [Ptychodera flava]|uniref:pancreatic triacylglycerol lipase-like n=1 Tax=Ptychodera flava TaxID=63121 RepID=UPI00396A4627
METLRLQTFMVFMLSSCGFVLSFQINHLLYTQSNPTAPQTLDRNDASSILNSNFDSSLPVKFIIHGYRESGNSEWALKMKDELLVHAPMNVIVVDWQDGSSGWYFTCSANTAQVGEDTHLLISHLQTQTGLSLNNVHLIGFSLGAQVAGNTGKRNPSIARISGLDPAGPDFSGKGASDRLDPTDAQFVDVLHTDGEPLWQGGFGYYEPCGHVDFYPNGGTRQPGCGLVGEICHHMRAPAYYTESINSDCPFTAYPCTLGQESCSTCNGNCGFMGFHADKSQANEVFYVETNSESPYCRG